MRFVSEKVSKNKVFAGVLSGFVFIYAVWEVRVRASHAAGKTPHTITREWQDASKRRLMDFEFVSQPEKRAWMNPHRNNVPPQKAVHPAP